MLPTEDFTEKTLVINDTYGSGFWEIVVLIMEVDKVADMEVDKVTVIKIPIEDLTNVILAIGDTYRDDARSGRQVGRHVKLTYWPNFQLMQVAPPGDQISN